MRRPLNWIVVSILLLFLVVETRVSGPDPASTGQRLRTAAELEPLLDDAPQSQHAVPLGVVRLRESHLDLDASDPRL